MELSHAMLMAGLRQRVGPDGDLQLAYREWYKRYQSIQWNLYSDENERKDTSNATPIASEDT
jgi:hypothetical protein